MFIYQKFLRDYLGKKKHSWTFTEVERRKFGISLQWMVTCVCDCGAIKYYPAAKCASESFPQSCVKCSRNKYKQHQTIIDKVLKSAVREGFMIVEEEPYDVIGLYEDYYKKHYRD